MKKSNKVPLIAAIVLSIAIAVPTIMYAAQQQRLWHRPCVTHWDVFKLMRVAVSVIEAQGNNYDSIERSETFGEQLMQHGGNVCAVAAALTVSAGVIVACKMKRTPL